MTAISGGQTGTMTKNDKTIIYWMDVFDQLYKNVDSNRSPVDMWVAATAHLSTMGEAIRTMDFAKLMKAASHAFCWMCSFVQACKRESEKSSVFALKESFSEIVASKYPLVCKHCREAYCHCNPKLMDSIANKSGDYKILLKKRRLLFDAPNEYSVSCWQGIFNDIYGQNTHMLTLESIGFHFLEEGGEELTALRSLKQLENVLDNKIKGIDSDFLKKLSKFEDVVELSEKYKNKKISMDSKEPEDIKNRLIKAKIDMYTEFADTFSWFCSILNKVMSIAQNCYPAQNESSDRSDEHLDVTSKENKCYLTENPFEKKLLEEYLPNGKPRCPSCKQSPCCCVFFIKHADLE